MKTSKQLTPRKKAAIVELRKAGVKQKTIARQLDFGKSAISKFIKRFESTGSIDRKQGQGWPRISTEADDKLLEGLSRADKKATAQELRQRWRTQSNVNASRETVNRRLLAMDLPARRPRKKPLLQPFQRENRLAFARKHQNWRFRDWKRVIFSDETWFETFSDAGKMWVRRRKGEEMEPDCLVSKVKHPQKVMIWGAITPWGKSKLVFIDGRVNAEKYLSILRESRITTFVKNHPDPHPLLMEDGAPAHRAKVVAQWHADRGIKLLPNWPGSSPDLNPIENVWGVMKRRIEKENPTNLEGIKKIILRVWRALDGDFLRKLYDSMPRRMDLVIKAKGGVTKY